MNERKIIPIREQAAGQEAMPGLEASKCAGGGIKEQQGTDHGFPPLMQTGAQIPYWFRILDMALN